MVKRLSRRLVSVGALATTMSVLAACGGGSPERSDGAGSGGAGGREASAPAGPRSTQGGTLRIGLVQDPKLDPATNDYLSQHFWAYLTRTLMTYPLTPVSEGGGEPVPDLADGPPTVSDDGLVWTFRLKPGIRYGPPFEDREVVAEDVATAIQRIADPAVASPFASNFETIEGFAEAQKRSGRKVSGVEVVDPLTIRFRLTKPTPLFAAALALPAAAPVPAEAVAGHEKDYGRFLVASGPYMVKGSESLDFSVPAGKQKPLSGYVPNRSLQLVRNPSWDPATDELRGANPDEVEFQVGGTAQTIADKVATGDLDVLLLENAPAQTIARYQANPNLRDQLHVNPKLSVAVLPMNLAQPPFDDVHVRRAANLIVDRDALARVSGGKSSARAANHFFVPGIVDNQNGDFAPYATASREEALAKAAEEMKQSKYDPGKTGRCTAAECRGVRFVPMEPADPANELLRQDFASIGIELEQETYAADTAYAKCADPREKVAICANYTFGAESPDAESIARYVYDSGIGPEGCCNVALLGATQRQLASWGYDDATPPPSVEQELLECSVESGRARADCYAAADQRISTEVVPFVYTLFPNQIELVSERVRNYTYDQFGYMSLNYAAVAP